MLPQNYCMIPATRLLNCHFLMVPQLLIECLLNKLVCFVLKHGKTLFLV